MHLGVDLASLVNSPVPAANRGVVVLAEPLGIYGQTVIIDHGLGVFSMYGHLSQIAVKPGDQVEKGTVLGKTGTTGLAGGDHLHFGVALQGEFVDPIEWWDAHWLKDQVEGVWLKATSPAPETVQAAAKEGKGKKQGGKQPKRTTEKKEVGVGATQRVAPALATQRQAMIIKINPQNPQERLLRQAVEALLGGGLIAYPTDTTYAVGCDLYNLKGIAKIYQIKRRPTSKPFSFICHDLKNISEYAQVGNYAYKVMKRLLPGPYTFVLEASRQVPKILQTKRRTVGIRVPDHPIALELVGLLGHPIISTSASLPDGQVESDPYEIEDRFKPHLALVIDAGIILPSPSSIISLIDDAPEVIREGKGPVGLFA